VSIVLAICSPPAACHWPDRTPKLRPWAHARSLRAMRVHSLPNVLNHYRVLRGRSTGRHEQDLSGGQIEPARDVVVKVLKERAARQPQVPSSPLPPAISTSPPSSAPPCVECYDYARCDARGPRLGHLSTCAASILNTSSGLVPTDAGAHRRLLAQLCYSPPPPPSLHAAHEQLPSSTADLNPGHVIDRLPLYSAGGWSSLWTSVSPICRSFLTTSRRRTSSISACRPRREPPEYIRRILVRGNYSRRLRDLVPFGVMTVRDATSQ